MNIELPGADAHYYPAFLSNAEEIYNRLLETTEWKQENVVIFGKSIPQPRLTAWYGDQSYTYSGLTVHPKSLTPIIRRIKEQVEAAAGAKFNSVLLNLYRDGRDSIGWHADDETGLGSVIASVSFGSSRRFLLRDTATRTVCSELLLGNGDLLVMGEGVQQLYQHHVPKTAKAVGPRINLTFRFMTPTEE